jgi:hypothetical protein
VQEDNGFCPRPGVGGAQQGGQTQAEQAEAADLEQMPPGNCL